MAIFFFIFFAVLVAYGVQIGRYRQAWNAMPEETAHGLHELPVAVVVAARNEEKNIGRLLSCLGRQDYPEHLFTTIVVDDHSTDSTAIRVKEFSGVQFLQLEPGREGKKEAITAGVRHADCELIVTTDADCEMGEGWLSSIVSKYVASGARFIAAPVMIERSLDWLGIFQSLDFMTMQGVTGGAIFRRTHTLCNGANLAYPKQAFEEAGGFEGFDQIPSGDDMFLMHKIWKRSPDKIFYLKSKEAIVTTKAERTWKEFFQQRIRWASKTRHFDDRQLMRALWLTYILNVCFLISALLSVGNLQRFGLFALFLIAKVLIEFPFINAVAIFFGRRKLMWYFIVLQPVHVLYIIIAGWLGRFGSYTWKGRRIKNSNA